MKLDRIIISVNDNSKYLQNWPLVAQLWNKLFPETKVSLGILTDNESELPMDYIKFLGEVEVFAPVEGFPVVNQSRILRHYMATMSIHSDEIIMLNDIDLLPLQRVYYLQKLLSMKTPDELLAIGGDFYRRYGKKCLGKFPMGYVTARGNTWSQIMNPAGNDWSGFVRQFKGVRVIDDKESIMAPDFCDESLLRALLRSWSGNIRELPMGFEQDSGLHSISRWKPFDAEKLKCGEYIEAHHLLPVDGYIEIIDAICKHFEISFNPRWLS